MRAGSEQWKIEQHGGGRRHQWREVAQTKEKLANTQAQIMIDRARQGGVRVLNPAGIIVRAWWRRHAPGARPTPVRFCIGCGCHDFDACIDPGNGFSCSWIATDPALAVGVCSACANVMMMERWKAGDRRVPA